jgi:hypothetical protein
MIAVLFIASAIPAMAQTNMKPANNDARNPCRQYTKYAA